MAYSFGDVELDTTTYELRRGGRRVPLEPQAFDVLTYLVQHRERVVPKEELMDQVWGGRFVSESAVTSRIKQARRAIGDSGEAQRLIRTVHGRGYHFVASVIDTASDGSRPDQPTRSGVDRGADEEASAVRYTQSDGLAIAYQVTGGGDADIKIDIVLVAGFISHLEQDWGDPRHAHFLNRLGSLGRLIRFDKRGTGMSDRPLDLPDLETRIHDVLAVMDAAGSERAYLLGYSEGGPMATLFAATHPERVAGLILYGASVKRTRAEDYPWARTEAEHLAYADQLVQEWDWESDMLLRCPSADAAMTRWWARRCRAAATPTTVGALMHMNAMVDVRDALPAVRVPTLVVHRRGDRLVRVEEGRYLAQHIAGARLIELAGDDHFVAGDPDQILDPIEAFLAERPHVSLTTLALAAVVALAGPDAAALAHQLSEHGGVRRRTIEDRHLVLFDGPATAVRAIHDVTAGLDASAGVHVAELDRHAPVLGGSSVATASQLAEKAPTGRIRVSSVVRDLLAGSGVAVITVLDSEDDHEPAYEIGPAIGSGRVRSTGRGQEPR